MASQWKPFRVRWSSITRQGVFVGETENPDKGIYVGYGVSWGVNPAQAIARICGKLHQKYDGAFVSGLEATEDRTVFPLLERVKKKTAAHAA